MGKGYEKSIGFDHELLDNIPNDIKIMLAGNIILKCSYLKKYRLYY